LMLLYGLHHSWIGLSLLCIGLHRFVAGCHLLAGLPCLLRLAPCILDVAPSFIGKMSFLSNYPRCLLSRHLYSLLCAQLWISFPLGQI
jgi:hypothetical protein